MRLFKAACILVCSLAPQILQAQGIVLVEEETHNGKAETAQVQMDKTHIRAETHAMGENAVVVFDAQAQVVRMIHPDKKTYNEIDKAQIDQLKQKMAGAQDQMSAAQKQMEERLQNMPPQQRAMVEQMMRGRGGMPGMPGAPGAASQPAIQYHQTGSDQVGSWTCTKYDGMRGQEKVAEVCTVDPSVFNVTPADFEAAKQLAEFLKTLAPEAAEQTTMYGSGENQGFTGVPVRRISYMNGNVTSTTILKEFRHESVPASTFDVPAGFTKETMGIGARP